MHEYTSSSSMSIGINEKKQICLPNKEYISDHRFEGTNLAAKCKTFLTLSTFYTCDYCIQIQLFVYLKRVTDNLKKRIGINEKNMAVKQRIFYNHRFEKQTWLQNVRYM